MVYKFTNAQTEYVVSERLKGVQWDTIRDSFNTKFKAGISSEAIRRRFRASGQKPIQKKSKEKEQKPPHPLENFTKEGLGSIVKVNDYNS
ncbi:MAG TPA: hypothetical protein VIJ14_10615, partial [Rhabdochlamydiaceae bacterium]